MSTALRTTKCQHPAQFPNPATPLSHVVSTGLPPTRFNLHSRRNFYFALPFALLYRFLFILILYEMSFDFSTLEPPIRQILSAPGTDLSTISAKRVRRQLVALDPSLSSEFLKENKEDVDAIIASVYEKVSATQGAEKSDETEGERAEDSGASRKRKQKDEDDEAEAEEANDQDGEEEEEKQAPAAKKAKKSGREISSDAELARKLSSEINGRSRRNGGKGSRATNGAPKKAARAKKSAATIDSDDDSESGTKKAKPKRKSTGGGAAKGGFAKEYNLRYGVWSIFKTSILISGRTISAPLASLLQTEKLSRPQVVKQLWDYIKGNQLQNPSNKKEILCDANFRAVFNVDKIDMFKMNKVLGQYVYILSQVAPLLLRYAAILLTVLTN